MMNSQAEPSIAALPFIPTLRAPSSWLADIRLYAVGFRMQIDRVATTQALQLPEMLPALADVEGTTTNRNCRHRLDPSFLHLISVVARHPVSPFPIPSTLTMVFPPSIPVNDDTHEVYQDIDFHTAQFHPTTHIFRLFLFLLLDIYVHVAIY